MAQDIITGVSLQPDKLEWTTVRQRKGQVEHVDHREAAIERPDAATEVTSPEMAPVLKKAVAGIKGTISLAVPTDQVLLRVTDLPSSDPAELASMVELQVDKFSPFPIEHMVVSFEVLHQQETASRVLIAALRREVVEDLGGALSRVGLLPHWIDVDVLAWWRLLVDHGAITAEGRDIIVLVTALGTELIATQDGVPVLFRSLGVHPGGTPADRVEELVEEVVYTLTSLEAEWGMVPTVRLALWASGEPAEGLAANLEKESGLPVQVHALEELGDLTNGLARRAACWDVTKINLAPPEWYEAERVHRSRKALLFAIVGFFVLWAVGLTVFLGGLGIQQREVQDLKDAVSELSGPSGEVKELQKKVLSLEQYADRTHSSLECLREVSSLLPGGVDLTSFVYKKAKSVSLRGEASSVEPIYDFIEALERSELFVEIKPEGITSKPRGKQARSEFRVTARLPGGEES